ncbi:50S ribosomal protein L18 [bacterium]|jgi:large subunit ribosomal protein L18|nr:50S ribosomal protein L18 [bacterium]MDP6571472.1 50S ribosomal protein L18 [Patescibacteria group bacterium]MDP6756471.1 50S ribosomal protein L18 [Patescibacteria group bacterium]|tara:strand:- start:2336 stop:2680 length:345 start_codon:yes stop_codon:yes gene_type:complete
MSIIKKQLNTKQRKARVRSNISGSANQPRVSVKSSLSGMFVQIIDDSKGATLASGSTKGLKGTKTERASQLGEALGKKAIEAGVKTVVFDRGPKQFHGRIKALAESLRKSGLKF